MTRSPVVAENIARMTGKTEFVRCGVANYSEHYFKRFSWAQRTKIFATVADYYPKHHTMKHGFGSNDSNDYEQRVAYHVNATVAQGLNELLGPGFMSDSAESSVQRSITNSSEDSFHFPSVVVANRSGSPLISTKERVSPSAAHPAIVTPKAATSTNIHSVSFIDHSMFTPGCMVVQLQFKHVYRDYVASAQVLANYKVEVGAFVLVKSHINPSLLDLGVCTAMYSQDEFLALKRQMGKSQDEEENFLGIAVRVATMRERKMLPMKRENEGPALQIAQHFVERLGLQMEVYEAEYQFDGRVLFLYYTADSRVDYRGLVHCVTTACNNTRVKMKKTNQCRKFVAHEFATVGLATGYVPGSDN